MCVLSCTLPAKPRRLSPPLAFRLFWLPQVIFSLHSRAHSLQAATSVASSGFCLFWLLQVSFPLRLCATLLSRWLCLQPLQLLPLKPAADETQSRVSSRCSGRWPPPWTPAVDGHSRESSTAAPAAATPLERLLSSVCTSSLHLWVCVDRKWLHKQV